MAYLILENGAVFKGQTFGYESGTVGELVFSTGMAGYLETLSDPRYYGQIVLQTFPLIGNYGIIPSDMGFGSVHLKAYIVREWCQEPSNFRSEGELDAFLHQNKIPGLYGVDTRALTRILRESGVMNAAISKTPELSEAQWTQLRNYRITNAVESCSGSENQAFMGAFQLPDGNEPFVPGETKVISAKARHKVALWDFGGANSVSAGLASRACELHIKGHSWTAEEILALQSDGIVLSPGPGDPADNTRLVDEIKKLCAAGIPIFGIGLGHQLLALAKGGKTAKLPFGHRGTNQPVSESGTGRVFITSQNHGYAVLPDTLPKTADACYVNANDGSCEGIRYNDIPAFSVQFNPDSGSSGHFYNIFIKMMEEGRTNAAE